MNEPSSPGEGRGRGGEGRGGEGEKREKGGEKPDGMSSQCLPSDSYFVRQPITHCMKKKLCDKFPLNRINNNPALLESIYTAQYLPFK